MTKKKKKSTMPTSSQSKILSTVDYQLEKQQSSTNVDGTTKSIIYPKSADRRTLKSTKEEIDESPRQSFIQRRSSLKTNDVPNSSRSNPNPFRRSSLRDETNVSPRDNRDDDDEQQLSFDDDEENVECERRRGQLNETARRLLILGTIRPSRTFYKDLPESDVEYLMEYFRRMRNNQRVMTSDEINEELTRKYVEYKPKVFFDSSVVTKHQVKTIEKQLEPFVDQIRTEQVELIKLENPLRFLVQRKDNNSVLTTIPHEFNDCLLTLISHSDPLRKSELIEKLIPQQLFKDVKDNSLDISYFPGGINYDVPREDIQDDGQMNLDTYKKIKQRLTHRKIRYFNEQPAKKVNAVIIVLPVEYPSKLTHQKLFDLLCERLKTLSTDENPHVEQKILSIEFIPLSCIFSSFDVANQFIVDFDRKETKQHFIDKPLTMNIHKQTISLETHSHDEFMQREYQNYLKAEKYRELVKNHDEAVKRSTTAANK